MKLQSISVDELVPGMVTDDGQTVLEVWESEDGELVMYDVFTDCDDLDERQRRMEAPETRGRKTGEKIRVFAESIDGDFISAS